MKITYKILIHLSIIITGFFIFQIEIGILTGFISLNVFYILFKKSIFNTQYINYYASKIKLTEI